VARGYNRKWVLEKDIFELLGTPFGLNLNILDIENFFHAKFSKKLDD
jgi:hypothetical protein